jgi:hypothetical protein
MRTRSKRGVYAIEHTHLFDLVRVLNSFHSVLCLPLILHAQSIPAHIRVRGPGCGDFVRGLENEVHERKCRPKRKDSVQGCKRISFSLQATPPAHALQSRRQAAWHGTRRGSLEEEGGYPGSRPA